MACNTGQLGVCAAGHDRVHRAAPIACNQNVQPSAEICDGLDNNCNGSTDEGNPTCYAAPPAASPAPARRRATPSATARRAALHGRDAGLQRRRVPACNADRGPGSPRRRDLQRPRQRLRRRDRRRQPRRRRRVQHRPARASARPARRRAPAGRSLPARTVQPSAETCDGIDNDCDGIDRRERVHRALLAGAAGTLHRHVPRPQLRARVGASARRRGAACSAGVSRAARRALPQRRRQTLPSRRDLQRPRRRLQRRGRRRQPRRRRRLHAPASMGVCAAGTHARAPRGAVRLQPANAGRRDLQRPRRQLQRHGRRRQPRAAARRPRRARTPAPAAPAPRCVHARVRTCGVSQACSAGAFAACNVGDCQARRSRAPRSATASTTTATAWSTTATPAAARRAHTGVLGVCAAGTTAVHRRRGDLPVRPAPERRDLQRHRRQLQRPGRRGLRRRRRRLFIDCELVRRRCPCDCKDGNNSIHPGAPELCDCGDTGLRRQPVRNGFTRRRRRRRARLRRRADRVQRARRPSARRVRAARRRARHVRRLDNDCNSTATAPRRGAVLDAKLLRSGPGGTVGVGTCPARQPDVQRHRRRHVPASARLHERDRAAQRRRPATRRRATASTTTATARPTTASTWTTTASQLRAVRRRARCDCDDTDPTINPGADRAVRRRSTRTATANRRRAPAALLHRRQRTPITTPARAPGPDLHPEGRAAPPACRPATCTGMWGGVPARRRRPSPRPRTCRDPEPSATARTTTATAWSTTARSTRTWTASRRAPATATTPRRRLRDSPRHPTGFRRRSSCATASTTTATARSMARTPPCYSGPPGHRGRRHLPRRHGAVRRRRHATAGASASARSPRPEAGTVRRRRQRLRRQGRRRLRQRRTTASCSCRSARSSRRATATTARRRPFIKPGAPELCDCQDNNCNGQVDEGNACYGAPCHDFDGDGVTNCQGDCNDHDALVGRQPSERAANGMDDDCDGAGRRRHRRGQDGYSVGQGDCNDKSPR